LLGEIWFNEVACIDWEDGIKQVFDSTIDLVLTDPPYSMAYRSNRRKEKHKSIQNDKKFPFYTAKIDLPMQ
jgi:DNA modification methylase